MTSSTRIRFGALAAAAAVVAGGFFAAAPANAATGTITIANTTFTEGDWGTGLDVTGSGFTADAVVTITVADSSPATLDSHQVTADATGAFHEVYVPTGALAPSLGSTVSVTATSDQGDTANEVPLALLLPKGIASSVSTISTADLTNKDKGIAILATGYTPGETVTATVDYNGSTLDAGTYTASAEGAVLFRVWLASGDAVAGTFTVTVTGETSTVTQSVDIQVTGDDLVVGGPPAVEGSTTAPASVPAQATKLPVVSG
ncbi:hypothetical protein AB4Z18_04370 [Leifsonia sp. 2TAF2]|uniref:hypothetical protein n=1 Tax=Leifsonia sp. 2TAF2 TaxID=3233009 RepID=UPI003F9B455E